MSGEGLPHKKPVNSGLLLFSLCAAAVGGSLLGNWVGTGHAGPLEERAHSAAAYELGKESAEAGIPWAGNPYIHTDRQSAGRWLEGYLTVARTFGDDQ